jgi:integrase
VSKERELNQRTRTLTAEEEQRLYDAAEASSWPMLKLFLRVCMTTGARRSEALNLQWTDLRLDQSHALLRRTKNGKPRVMPLVDDVVTELRKVERGKLSRFVFADPADPRRPKNINTVWRQCREAAGLLNDRDDPLDRVFLHSTRHTVSTRLIRSGANLAETASITGHLTVSALSRYVHLDSQHSIDLAQRVLGKQQ